MHYQLDEGLDDTLQVCRVALSVEKETAIVEMSQKTRLARFIFCCSTLETAGRRSDRARAREKVVPSRAPFNHSQKARRNDDYRGLQERR